MRQLLACAKPCCYITGVSGLRAGTYCAVLRDSLLIDCVCVCHLSNKELLYFTFTQFLTRGVYAPDGVREEVKRGAKLTKLFIKTCKISINMSI